MFEQLFLTQNKINFAVSKDPNTEFILRSYQREIEKVIEYYNRSNFTVNAKHLINRLLYNYQIPLEYDDQSYLRAANARANVISRAYRFLNELNFPNAYKANFYNQTQKEIYTYTQEYINLVDFKLYYKKASPVNVLLHHESDISLALPLSSDRSYDLGNLSFISINLPLLSLQYKYYQIQELANQESVTGIEHFVIKNALPPMLYSHFDMSVFNRAYALFYSIPFTHTKAKLPFKVIDYKDKLDKILNYAIERCRNRSIKYTAMLEHFPSIYKESLLESLKLPEYTPTRQAHWGYFYTRIKVMEFLIDLGGQNGLLANRDEINDLKREVRYFKSDNVFTKVFDEDSLEYLEVMSFFEKVENL